MTIISIRNLPSQEKRQPSQGRPSTILRAKSQPFQCGLTIEKMLALVQPMGTIETDFCRAGLDQRNQFGPSLMSAILHRFSQFRPSSTRLNLSRFNQRGQLRPSSTDLNLNRFSQQVPSRACFIPPTCRSVFHLSFLLFPPKYPSITLYSGSFSPFISANFPFFISAISPFCLLSQHMCKGTKILSKNQIFRSSKGRFFQGNFLIFVKASFKFISTPIG